MYSGGGKTEAPPLDLTLHRPLSCKVCLLTPRSQFCSSFGHFLCTVRQYVVAVSLQPIECSGRFDGLISKSRWCKIYQQSPTIECLQCSPLIKLSNKLEVMDLPSAWSQIPHQKASTSSLLKCVCITKMDPRFNKRIPWF